MIDFYRTGMGQKFFEGTVPSLVRQLERLNDNLVAIREQLAQKTAQTGAIDPATGREALAKNQAETPPA